MTLNQLPFQYLHRAAFIESLSSEQRAEVLEQRDRDLEDFLGRLAARIAELEGP